MHVLNRRVIYKDDIDQTTMPKNIQHWLPNPSGYIHAMLHKARLRQNVIIFNVFTLNFSDLTSTMAHVSASTLLDSFSILITSRRFGHSIRSIAPP